MAVYKMMIHTGAYKPKRCSKKNWEPGTQNDYMAAINGITRSLHSMREVMWQLKLFRGNSFLDSEYSEENHGLSDKYLKFLEDNKITYFDHLCSFERTQYLSGYGFMQGDLRVSVVLETLKREGSVTVPFSSLYDARQYDKHMDGCYMKITRRN